MLLSITADFFLIAIVCEVANGTGSFFFNMILDQF